MRFNLVLALALLLAPLPLFAQKSSKAEEAKILKEAKEKLSQGKKFLDQGQFERALVLFREGHQIYQDPEFLLFQGRALLKLKRYQEAKAAFEGYLAEQKLSPKKKEELTRLIEELSLILTTFLEVKTNPSGAALWLDTRVEATLGTSPFVGNILPGPHILIIEYPGYAVTRYPFEAAPGETTQLSITLTEAPSPLHVETDPPGADLFLNGAPLGKTPYDGEVPPGQHQLVAQKPGFGKLTFTIEGRFGKPISLSGRLPPPPGVVKVSSASGVSIPEARILLDGAEVSAFPGILEASPGAHLLAVKAPGYRSFEKKLDVLPAEEISLVVSLLPEGLSLSVTSNIPGAKILLDGVEVGTTPSAEKIPIAQGEKAVIEVKQEGYLPFRKKISARKDRDLILEVALRKPGLSPRPLLALGAAGAAGATGAVFGALALANDKKFAEVPSPELLQTIRRQALLSNVSFGLAGVSLVGAALLLRKEGGLGGSPGKLTPVASPESVGVQVSF